MGMGEPLANYLRVMTRRRIHCARAEGLGAGQRHITVSTVGLVPAIRRMIEEDLQVTSRPDPCTPPTTSCATSWCRSTSTWKVAEVLDAAWAYTRVPVVAVDRVRDDQGCQRPAWRADLLGRLLSGRLAQ